MNTKTKKKAQSQRSTALARARGLDILIAHGWADGEGGFYTKTVTEDVVSAAALLNDVLLVHPQVGGLVLSQVCVAATVLAKLLARRGKVPVQDVMTQLDVALDTLNTVNFAPADVGDEYLFYLTRCSEISREVAAA